MASQGSSSGATCSGDAASGSSGSSVWRQLTSWWGRALAAVDCILLPQPPLAVRGDRASDDLPQHEARRELPAWLHLGAALCVAGTMVNAPRTAECRIAHQHEDSKFWQIAAPNSRSVRLFSLDQACKPFHRRQHTCHQPACAATRQRGAAHPFASADRPSPASFCCTTSFKQFWNSIQGGATPA